MVPGLDNIFFTPHFDAEDAYAELPGTTARTGMGSSPAWLDRSQRELQAESYGRNRSLLQAAQNEQSRLLMRDQTHC